MLVSWVGHRAELLAKKFDGRSGQGIGAFSIHQDPVHTQHARQRSVRRCSNEVLTGNGTVRLLNPVPRFGMSWSKDATLPERLQRSQKKQPRRDRHGAWQWRRREDTSTDSSSENIPRPCRVDASTHVPGGHISGGMGAVFNALWPGRVFCRHTRALRAAFL